MHKSWVWAAAVVTAAAMVGCGEEPGSQPAAPGSAPGTSAGSTSGAGTSGGVMEQVQAKAGEATAAMQKQWDALSSQVASLKAGASASADAQLKSLMGDLDKKMEAAKAKLEEAKTAASDKAAELQAEATKLMDQAKEMYGKAIARWEEVKGQMTSKVNEATQGTKDAVSGMKLPGQ
ncbi:MAG: hypothetical protein IT442_14580 [Phycisphaeraceae bacterium]|nr:hypothetical protein [Phycisphaeraceae bacterium]